MATDDTHNPPIPAFVSDPAVAQRLLAVPGPGVRVVLAAHQAALDTPANAAVLYNAVDVFLNTATATRGDGNILHLQRSFDEPLAPLTAERTTIEAAASALPGDPAHTRRHLNKRGFIDASDPTHPMAALWVHLDRPIMSTAHRAARPRGAAIPDGPMPTFDPAVELAESLAAIALWLSFTTPNTRTTTVFRDSVVDRLEQLAHQAEDQYERVAPASGEVPTPAQGITLARLLRSRLRDPSDYATVSLGDVIALPDGYIAVRFKDGFEAGIDRDGVASS